MNNRRIQTVWWCCMLPSFGAMAMLLYEWGQDKSETRLLFYAILCPILAVIFGAVIVNSAEQSAKDNADPKKAKKKNSSAFKTVEEKLDESAQGWGPLADYLPKDVLVNVSNDLVNEGSVSALDSISSAPTAAPVSNAPQAIASAQVSAQASASVSASVGSVNHPASLSESLSSDNNSNESTSASGGKSADSAFPVIALGPPAGRPSDLDFSELLGLSSPVEILNSALQTGPDVERANEVYNRLEAKVARAEEVTAKLESELARVAPTTAHLDFQPDAHSEIAGHENATTPSAAMPTSGGGRNASLIDAADGSKVLPNLKTIDEWLDFAEKLIDEHDYDDAVKCYDKVIALDGKSFDAWLLKSVALRRKGHSEDAIYCVNYAISLYPSSVSAFIEKGECLFQLGKSEQSITWFDKAIAIDALNAKPWVGKARSLAACGKHKEAVKYYEKVLTLDPNNEEARKAKTEIASKIATH